MTLLKLLLVENDSNRAARLIAALSSGNLDVVSVPSAEAAASALAIQQFDVVFLASNTASGKSPLTIQSPERNNSSPVVIVWGEHPDASGALAIAAALPEQELAAEILRMHQEARRRDTDAESLSVFDSVEFHSQMGGDEDLIREVVELFFTDSLSQLQSIRTMIEGADCRGASRLAHSLKGALGSLRAARAQHFAGILEKTAAAGDAPRVRRAFATLEKAMDELAAELRHIVPA
jgi:HPt (histidine-containing phosphotransfer) domain-containing protein